MRAFGAEVILVPSEGGQVTPELFARMRQEADRIVEREEAFWAAPGELAFHRCYSAHPVPLATLVKVAGRRWTVEESFQSAKGLAGLDEH